MTRAKEKPYIDGTKQNLKVGTSTSLAVYGIASGVAWHLKDNLDDPEYVQDWVDILENPRTWLAIGVAFMGLQYYLNRRTKQKILKQEEDQTYQSEA